MDSYTNKKLISAINTLLHSWGSGTPPEAIWALNEFIEFLNNNYKTNIDYLSEQFDDKEYQKLLQKVRKLISN